MFRNNVGLAEYVDRTGVTRKVQYGLCKGSSDLIGWTPRIVHAEDVGKPVAVFTAIEVKAPGGKVTEDQQNFLEMVRHDGGIAATVYNETEAENAIRNAGVGQHATNNVRGS